MRCDRTSGRRNISSQANITPQTSRSTITYHLTTTKFSATRKGLFYNSLGQNISKQRFKLRMVCPKLLKNGKSWLWQFSRNVSCPTTRRCEKSVKLGLYRDPKSIVSLLTWPKYRLFPWLSGMNMTPRSQTKIVEGREEHVQGQYCENGLSRENTRHDIVVVVSSTFLNIFL